MFRFLLWDDNAMRCIESGDRNCVQKWTQSNKRLSLLSEKLWIVIDIVRWLTLARDIEKTFFPQFSQKDKNTADFLRSQFKLINRNGYKEEREWFHDLDERTCVRNVLRLINYMPGSRQEREREEDKTSHRDSRWNLVFGNAKCRDGIKWIWRCFPAVPLTINSFHLITNFYDTHLQHKSGTFRWILRMHFQQNSLYTRFRSRCFNISSLELRFFVWSIPHKFSHNFPFSSFDFSFTLVFLKLESSVRV